jgi:hypothetical protein
MNYQQLLNRIKSMSKAQLTQEVKVYCGNIDDTIEVLGVIENTKQQMGESLKGYSKNQSFIQIGD